MNTLTVWRFDGPETAAAMLPEIERRIGAGVAAVDDAALVSWPERTRKPSMRGLGSITGPGRLWGGFWGLVLGLIFLTPIAGPVFGAAAGAIAASLSDFGVADVFVKSVRDSVTPGSSAIFLMSTRESADRLAAALPDGSVQTIRSGFSREQAQRLLDVLGEETAHRVD